MDWILVFGANIPPMISIDSVSYLLCCSLPLSGNPTLLLILERNKPK